jgi:lysophospholipase L1-like esterase
MERFRRRLRSRALQISPFILAVLAVLATTALPAAGAGREDPRQRWLGTWAASPQPPHVQVTLDPGSNVSRAGLANQTVRQIVSPHRSGTRARIRLANTFGTQPLTIDQADIAVQSTGAAIVPGSDRRLTFGGRSRVMIPVGAEASSDLVSLEVQANRTLAISLYVSQATGPTTFHWDARQTNFVASGNQAADQSGASYSPLATSWFWLDGVDVTAAPQEAAIVALGDSITDGAASTLDANARWPDFLARRLARRPDNRLSVLDEGISGNRVLNDSPCFGVNALARLDRDVLAQDGVRYVIVLEGINDIGFSAVNPEAIPPEFLPCFSPNTDVSADQIIAGYQQIITQVHLKGLRVFGGTLTPFKGAAYYSAAGEAKRQAVNTWIRTSGEFDGVIDFAAATRDPADPLMLRLAYDSGDHLHPNDAGYQAMANAIDLSLFTPFGD